MGIIRTELMLRNPARGGLEPVNVKALVDTRAVHLCIPEHLAINLTWASLKSGR